MTDILQHLCSQGRSFLIDQAPLPVCQRCLGLYAGFGLTVVWLAVSGIWRRGLPPASVLALHVGLLLAAMAGGLHWLDPGPRWRLACGLVTGHVAAVWIIGGMMEVRAGSLFRNAPQEVTSAFCRNGPRGDLYKIWLSPFPPDSLWPRWATLQAVLAVPLLFVLAMAFPSLEPLGWWFWTVVALTGIAAAMFTVGAAVAVVATSVWRITTAAIRLHQPPAALPGE